MKRDMSVLPVLKYNASSLIYTNIDDIDTFYRVKNKTTVFPQKNISEVIQALDEYDIKDDTYIYIIFKVESEVDILKLSDILKKKYLPKIMCMRFTLPIDIQNELPLRSIFIEFNIKKHDTTYQFTPGVIDAIRLDQDTITKLLWSDVFMVDDTPQKKPGMHFIMDGMKRDTLEISHEWKQTWITMFTHLSQTYDSKNFLLFSKLIAYAMGTDDVVPASIRAKKSVATYLYDRMYTSCVRYFTKRFEDNPLDPVLLTLYELKSQNASPFYFPEQYMYDSDLQSKLHNKDAWMAITNPNIKAAMSIFIRDQEEMTKLEGIDILVKKNVIGNALTAVVNKLLALNEKQPIVGKVMNDFIKDQIIRISVKLKASLPKTISRESVLYVMNVLFECNFSQEVPFISYETLLPFLPDITSVWAFKEVTNEDQQLILFELLYQYAFHAYTMLHDSLSKSIKKIKVIDVERQMNVIRSMLSLTPTDVSKLFPMSDTVVGLLVESFFEFIVLFHDLIDGFTPNSFNSPIDALIGFAEMPTDENYLALPNKQHFPSGCEWITEGLVGHMFTVNYINLNYSSYRTYYTFLINLIRVYKSDKSKTQMNRFIRQFSGRGNLIPIDMFVDKVKEPLSHNWLSLATEQSELRKTSVPLQDTLRDEIMRLNELIHSEKDTEHINYVNLIIRFSQGSRRPIPKFEFPEKTGLFLNSEDLQKEAMEQYKILYAIYKERSTLLYTPKQINDLRRKMIQLMKTYVDKQCTFTFEKIADLLNGMNQYNVHTLFLVYSILYKMCASPEKATLFGVQHIVPNFILYSEEELACMTQIGKHITWVSDMPIHQMENFATFILGMSLKEIAPIWFNPRITYKINKAVNHLSGLTTEEFIVKQVEDTHTYMTRVFDQLLPDWLDYFKRHTEIRDSFLEKIREYKLFYNTQPTKATTKEYQEALMGIINSIKIKLIPKIKETVYPPSLMVVLNYLYTNFHRFYWYERLVSDTKIPSYLFMEQFEHMLEYYLTCDTSPFFGELFEMVHANDIAQLRSKMGVINQMFTKFNLLTHAHFSTLSEDKVKITLSFYRALFTSAKTIVEQYDQQQKLAAIQSQKP
jgi:hypothetical protein